MKEIYVLDACAFIAFLDDEKGANIIVDLIQKADDMKIEIFMHRVNFLEVFYHTSRKHGIERAFLLFRAIYTYPINLISGLSNNVFLEAGRLKSMYKLSIADSIGLALSIIQNGRFVTCDHHEMDIIQKKENLDILWVR